MTKKCKADSVSSVCVDCESKSDNNVVWGTSDKPSPKYSISPITNECDPSKIVLVHLAISSLLEGVVINKELELNDYRDEFKRKLTHLDPKLHNIFSLNLATTEPVNGLFLSPHSVMTLLLSESKFRVTEELLNFFVDCFNFHGEYLPVEKKVSESLPGILFCKPNDDVAKINVLYNKKQF